MNSIIDDFDSFIEKISLNKDKCKDIESKFNEISSIINEKENKDYSIIDVILSGSYGKKTTINEYDPEKKPDVDIIVLIDNKKLNSDKVNNDFYSFFKEKKKNVVQDLRIQSNSIGLVYSNISVDVVIGFKKDSSDIIMISSDKNNDWIESNCILHKKYMEKKSKEYERFDYRDLMKLFKYFNKEILNNSLKSFTLEQLIHQSCPKPSVDLTICKAFYETLLNISRLKSIDELRDCCFNEKKGYDDKDIEVFDAFIEEIKDYIILTEQALNGDRKKWELVFGERFPKQVNEKVINNYEYDKKQTPWNDN